MHQSFFRLSVFLKHTITAIFALNILTLPAVPFLLALRRDSGLKIDFGYFSGDPEALAVFIVTSVFYVVCGVFTAVVLWQGRRVMLSIVRHSAFSAGNADCLRRAGVCFFAISAAALLRTIINFIFFSADFFSMLTDYNTLFIPVFALAGLLCLVLSHLFRQAAALKEENDLTI